MVQPYVCIHAVKQIKYLFNDLTNNITASTSNFSNYPTNNLTNNLTANSDLIWSKYLDISWYTGGASTVDATFLTWHQINDSSIGFSSSPAFELPDPLTGNEINDLYNIINYKDS